MSRLMAPAKTLREGDIMDIGYIAKLARLDLNSAEKKKFSKQLSSILRYAEKLNQLDTTDVKPTAHIIPINNIWREDKAGPSLKREALEKIMPYLKEGFYKVPPVIE